MALNLSRISNLNGLIIYLCIALLLISSFDTYVSGIRYVKYLIPVCVVLPWLTYGQLKLNKYDITYPFFVVLFHGILTIGIANTYGVYDLYFYVSALAPFVFLGDGKVNLTKVFYGIIIVFLANYLPNVLKSGFSYSLVHSESSLESDSFSFVFGLFCVYFWCSKDKKSFLIALLLCFLSLKRISLFGVFAVVFIWFLPRTLRATLNSWTMVLVNLMFVFVAWLVTTSEFNVWSVEVFGIDALWLTSGRSMIYEELFYRIESDLSILIFGAGLGESYTLTSFILNVDSKYNVHSDVLKIFYEQGIIVFLLFFYLLHKVKGPARYIALYLNVILMTDNVSTYVFVMFFYFLLANRLAKVRTFD